MTIIYLQDDKKSVLLRQKKSCIFSERKWKIINDLLSNPLRNFTERIFTYNVSQPDLIRQKTRRKIIKTEPKYF